MTGASTFFLHGMAWAAAAAKPGRGTQSKASSPTRNRDDRRIESWLTPQRQPPEACHEHVTKFHLSPFPQAGGRSALHGHSTRREEPASSRWSGWGLNLQTETTQPMHGLAPIHCIGQDRWKREPQPARLGQLLPLSKFKSGDGKGQGACGTARAYAFDETP